MVRLRSLPFLGFGPDLPVKLASSKDLHLYALLYPPHCTFRFRHCSHVGFDSSHFNRFPLHVMHPFRLLLCLGFVIPPLCTPAVMGAWPELASGLL